MELPSDVRTLVDDALAQSGAIVWLTGAGISAESGIPTFRGKEGYWTVGSRNYHPTELATHAAFVSMPQEVWSWYLYRRSVCRSAQPNDAHHAIAELDAELGDKMLLITQNVDGLHLRAGSPLARTFQIHGNIDYMRPVSGGRPELIDERVDVDWPRGRQLTAEELDLLRCGSQRARPHVLWFDETYDEENFRFESSIEAALGAPLLIVVGTTGGTNLPLQIGALCARRGVPIIVVNPEPNPFSELVEHTGQGAFLQGVAGQWVPALATALRGH